MRNKILTLALCCFSFAALAEAPGEIAKTIKATAPYSTATLSWLMWDAYDAELWTDAEKWSYEAPFALRLRYKMGFTTEELVSRTIDEIKAMDKISTPEKYQADLEKAFPNVAKNDRITAVFLPPHTVKIFHNGTATHRFSDAVFARAFFNIWLSEKSSNPKFSRTLLKAN